MDLADYSTSPLPWEILHAIMDSGWGGLVLGSTCRRLAARMPSPERFTSRKMFGDRAGSVQVFATMLPNGVRHGVTIGADDRLCCHYERGIPRIINSRIVPHPPKTVATMWTSKYFTIQRSQCRLTIQCRTRLENSTINNEIVVYYGHMTRFPTAHITADGITSKIAHDLVPRKISGKMYVDGALNISPSDTLDWIDDIAGVIFAGHIVSAGPPIMMCAYDPYDIRPHKKSRGWWANPFPGVEFATMW